MSLYQRLDGIAKRMDELETQVRAVGNQPQAQRTSVEGGSIDFNDADGNLKAIVGQQFDGGTTINVVAGPTPPTPSAPVTEVTYGGIKVRWDGLFEGDAVAPTDWARVQVYARAGQFVTATPDNAKGSIVSAAGDEVVLGVEKGTWTVCLASWSQAGKVSAMSAPVTVEVPGYGDLVQAAIDEAQRLIDQAKQALEEAQQELDGKLTAVEGELESLPADIAQARQEAIDAALAEINAVEGNLTTALGLKNKTTWSTSNPPTTYAGVVEDTWIKLTSLGSGGREIGRWRWTGNVWVTHVIDGAVLSNIDASTITTGFLDVVNRIRAGAITADKILIGAGAELCTDPFYDGGPTTPVWEPITLGMAGPGSGIASTGAMPGRSFGMVIKPKPAQSNMTLYSPVLASGHRIPVDPGGTYSASMWVYATEPITGMVDNTGNYAGMNLQIYTYNSNTGTAEGPDGRRFAGSRTGTFPAGQWIKIQGQFTVGPNTTFISPRPTAYFPNNAPTRTGDIYFGGVSVRNAVGGTLIEQGGIKTPNLAADVLEVGNLKAGAAALAEAVIQKLWAEVVVARMVTAQEFIGENAILTGAVTASKITASEELWAKIGEFVRIRTGMLEADAIDGMVVTGATIQTARTGARVTQDASGLSVYDDNDDWRVRLTPYGSTFKGDLEAESLVSTGPAEFRHTENRLGQGAKLVLEAGVADPTAPPIVQPFWRQVQAKLPEGVVPYGLAFTGGKLWTFIDVPKSSEGDRLVSINPTSGEIVDEIPMTDGFWAAYGVTAIGSRLYVLGPKSGVPYGAFVRVYETTGQLVKEWEYTQLGHGPRDPLGYKPGIGTDRTNVVIAHCTDAGSLIWRTFNKDTGALIATVDTNDQTRSDILGAHIGTSDWGSGTWATFAKATTRSFVSFATSGSYDPLKAWESPAKSNEVGLCWDGTAFRSMSQSGLVTTYEGTTIGDGGTDWWGAYRWVADVDNDGSIDRSSRISPAKQFTWPKRSRLKFMGNTLPLGATFIGPAVAKSTTKPAKSDFRAPAWQVRAGDSVAWYDAFPADWRSAPVPPDSNTFQTATPSSIVSASNTFAVNGDGSGRWGPLEFHADGTMTSSAVPAWVPITAFASGFSVGSFGYAPAYRVWPDGKVEWRGTINGNVTGFSVDAFTIPAVARPAQAAQGRATTNAVNGIDAVTRCEFRPEAAPTKFRIYRGSGDRTWFSLDGIYYYLS